MNFSGTTPNDIYEWIEKKNNGDDTDYLNGKQDTEEAIDIFQSLYGCTFKNVYRFSEFLTILNASNCELTLSLILYSIS